MPIHTREGEQFDPAFLEINPNAKTPAIVDTDTGARVFDSSTAILLYLADKTGQFVPEATPALRAAMRSWLLLIATGIGPDRARPCISSTSYRRSSTMRSPPTTSKPGATGPDQRSPRRPGFHGRRPLFDRRHGGLGLSRPVAVRHGRRPCRCSRTPGACPTESAPVPPPKVPLPSSRRTHSRPKWTMAPGRTCSRRSANAHSRGAAPEHGRRVSPRRP